MARLTHIVLASCVSGVALGAGARLVMRFVALESGMSPGFSAGGSLEVVVFGAMVGIPAALVFFAVRSRVQIPRPWVGLFWGLFLFGVLSVVPPPAARSAIAGTPDTPAATAIAFALLFVVWGLGLEYLGRRSERPPSTRAGRSTIPRADAPVV